MFKKSLIVFSALLVALGIAAGIDRMGSLPGYDHIADVGKVAEISPSGVVQWATASSISGAALAATGAVTNNDLVAFAGTGGAQLKDSGVPLANVVQTSRQVSAGTGLTVSPQAQLTSDITMSMATTDNQSLTVVGTLTASGPLVGTSTAAITGNETIGGTLAVTGNATFAGTVGVQGALGVTGNLRVSGGTVTLANSITAVVFNNSSPAAFVLEDSSANITAIVANNTGNHTMQVTGTNTNDNAGPGIIGEVISSQVNVGSQPTLVNNVTTTITSFTLTAGDWDVSAVGCVQGNSTGTVITFALSTTTNSFTGSLAGDSSVSTPTQPTPSADVCMTIPTMRKSLTGSTSFFLVVKDVFTVGSPTPYGRISARRMR